MLVRFEGQQEDGHGGHFPLFTIFKRRTVKFSDNINRVIYEPDTTIGTKGILERFKAFAPDLPLADSVAGTIFELPL